MAEANCPGRWVIYEVLKSIFEAVIYLTALSLNKHRIRLIIVTVETQHPNGLASAARPSPGPAPARPGARSARSCTLAAPRHQAPQPAASARLPPAPPGAPRRPRARPCLSPPALSCSLRLPPARAPEKNLPRAEAPSPSCRGACTCCPQPAAARAGEDPWPGSFPGLSSPEPVWLRGLLQGQGTLSFWLIRSGKAEGLGSGGVLGIWQVEKGGNSFCSLVILCPSMREGNAPFA